MSGTLVVPVMGTAQPAGATTPTTVTDTFGFDSDALQNFTVPADVTSLTITATGGQGGWGGADSSGNPPPGGYQGQVSGTISVDPGDYLTIGVGAGADEPDDTGCTAGRDETSPADPYDAAAGINPLSQYDGGMGGAPGYNGCSGYGGAGGAATAVEIGSSSTSPTSIGTIVAGGGGGDGGSGQYTLVRGQIGLASYVPPSSPTPITYGIPAGCTTGCTSHSTIESPSPLPTSATQGQAGIAVFTMCGGDTSGQTADQFFNTGAPEDEAGCDGGGGAGGGGGYAGGSAGNDEFGSGSSDEWYGQGGSPGENSTGGFPGLTAVDEYFADKDTGAPTGTDTFADPGAEFDGSVVITYSTGIPAAPTSVTGSAGNGNVALQWNAPSSTGAAAISDYIIQYSSNGGSTWTSDDTGSTSTSATVSGLTNGAGYIFEVEAVNSVGDGPFSTPSGTLTPSGPPGAPVIISATPEDGALQVSFTPPVSTAPITGYLYQLDGSGPWLPTSAASSPLTISGLTDGTTYSVEIEAVNSIGAGSPSSPVSQTPVALPGAPTITSVQVGAGSASIAFTPGSDGGSAITGYRYSTDGGSSWTPTSTASPLSLTGLANGTAYSFELEAVNGSGDGAPASTSFTTPSAPSTPVVVSIVSQNQALGVTFVAPASGGSPITDYEWSTDGSTWYSESAFGTPCQNAGGSLETCEIAALSSDGSTALTNGTAYPIEIRAVNAVGDGSPSSELSGTPYTTPGAPTITTGASGMVPSNQSLTVAFSPPEGDGGSAITAYQYSTDAGATWQSRTDGQAATSMTMTISALSSDGETPLTNGATYDVEIRAVNAAGDGPGSAVASGIPVTVPEAPAVTSVTPEDGALGVSFTPASNGGSAVTSYEYSVNGGAWEPTGSLSPGFTISGLSNGTSYAVEVLAVNAAGDSPPSAAVSGAPVTVPGQPTITATSRGNATLSISYSDPSTGGSPITSYQYSTDGGVTWSTATSGANPLVISALSTNGSTPISNGTEYPVEVRAVNAVGDSLASSPVDLAPATVPGAPSVTLVSGDGAITVESTIADNGGSPITGIDYSLDGGAFVSTGTTSSTFTIPGLVNGTNYSVSVRADNAIGPGTASAPESATPITVPGSPTDVLATSDSASADVAWSAPASDGGSAVTGYTATAYTSAAGTTTAGTACTSAAPSCSVTGLANGTTYYIGVVATNAAGSGPASSPLQAVTPLARPGAPTLTGISSGDSYLSVSFTAGAAGGDPITSYQYSLNGGTNWSNATGTSSPIVIDGLTDGTSYTVSLRAVSAAGVGAGSNSKTGTPYTYPDTVDSTTISANGENGQIVVAWTDPGDGGSAITEAQATAFSSLTGGSQEGTTCTTTTNLATGDTTSCTVTGLTNGTTYYISTQSENAAGWSGRSSPRVAATPSIDPGAVSAVTGVAGDGQVTVSWTPGSTGGSSISDYTVWYSSGGAYTRFNDGTSTNTSATVTGLTNGTAYTFEVYAVNSNGTGPASSPSSPVTPTGPSITSAALPGGEVGVTYAATPSASGGTAPYTWSVTDGSLPTGLSLNTATGAVGGTPTSSGTFGFDLTATDSADGTASQAETVEVAPAPAITSPPLSAAEVGVAYNATVSVSGGTGPYTWSVTGGSLPTGLSLDTATGAITGVPTAGGVSTFDLDATDLLGDVATQSESIVVTPAPAITSASLPGGEVEAVYDVTPSVSGGTGPFFWSVTGGSLPAGLTLDTSTGAITGTPTTAGTSAFDLDVTDQLGNESTQPESVVVTAAPGISSASLPDGEVGSDYLAAPSVSGGTGPYTWSVSAGSLPAGLSLDAGTGEITGTPTAAGTSTFDLVATDVFGNVATQAESVTVSTDPGITSPALPGGEVGVGYDVTLSASGGLGPYTWSISGGSLPAGLSLDAGTGEITGTPTAAGTSTFDVTATDLFGNMSTQTESVDVVAAPGITSAVVGDGEVGVPYDAIPAASGGTGPYTWSVSAGSLPAGLSLDAGTGEITGTPTAAGTSTFDLVATDSLGNVATQAESVTVSTDPGITSPALPGGEVGVVYDMTPTAAGGTGGYLWSVTSGSLPAGLTLDPATGEMTGTPTVPGTSIFTLEVTDSRSEQGVQTEAVDVVAAPGITSAVLGDGEVGVPYDAIPAASGGTGPYTWSVSAGSLPAGLSLDAGTGEITGTPTAAGTSTFDLVATDSLGNVATQAESVTVSTDPGITSPALPGGEVGVVYDMTPTAAGGTGGYLWSVTSGSLPAGLTLDPATGEMTGTPTVPGTSIFTLEVTDSRSEQGVQTEAVDVVAAPGITSAVLGDGEVGAPYDAVPAASGGTGPYTWSVSAGSLPAGLRLDHGTGAVTGTPRTGGDVVFALKATDARGRTASQSESFVIAGVPTIIGTGLRGGEVGVAYRAAASVSGGTGPYTWSVTHGSLPVGLGLDPSTGTITGTPTASGKVTFSLGVTDAMHVTATLPESVMVIGAPTAVGATVSGHVGVAVGQQLDANGGTKPYRWSVYSGSLPSGVVLLPDGHISGVPAQSGTFVVKAMVKDARGRVFTVTITLVVTPSSLNSRPMAVTPNGHGYWVASADGNVTAFGAARSYGSLAGRPLSAPIVGMASTPDGKGYWLAASDGGVFAFGDARFFGSEGGHPLNRPVVGMATTPDGRGYWLVASDGGIFTFGDARFFGSEGGHPLNRPVVGMAATPDGRGYWLVASDGGVFTFGQAEFYGSEGAHPLNRPVVGMAATPNGRGYWLVASDGGVFTFGHAEFYGSQADRPLNLPVGGIESTQNGDGYWLVAADGGVFAFGDAGFLGADPSPL